MTPRCSEQPIHSAVATIIGTAIIPQMPHNGAGLELTVEGSLDHLPGLLPHHRSALHARGLSDRTIVAAGFTSETNYRQIAAFLGRRNYPAKNGPAIVLPCYDSTGALVCRRVRPDNTPTEGGKPRKYLHPKGVSNRPYYGVGAYEKLRDNPLLTAYTTEGEFKTQCLNEHIGPCIGFFGIDCWSLPKSAALHPELETLPWKGRAVYIVPDSDFAGNESVQLAVAKQAAAFKARGAIVKVVIIPPGSGGEKQGADDFIAKHGAADFWKLVNAAEDPASLEGEQLKSLAKDADPATEAQRFLQARMADGLYRLVFHQGGFLAHERGCWRDVKLSEVRAQLIRHCNRHLYQLGTSKTADILDQVRAHGLLPSRINAPAWIGDRPAPWPANESLATPTQIINLRRLLQGDPNYRIEATPRLFVTSALDYEFDPNAPQPVQWLRFLSELWGSDEQSIDLWQEWMGLQLVPDTTYQKILMLIGPPRSGKGVKMRVMRSVVGEQNCAAPTLAGIGTNFGLWPLIGKPTAIINDARLDGRTAQALVTERLLSISGEDALDIDRKFMEPITVKLPCRITIVSNELPRLSDASGALAGRMVLLRLTKSFYGREDQLLTAKLLEEKAGILLWAIAGWERLRNRGHFVQPSSSKELLEELQDLASPISKFIRERCITGAQYRASIAELYQEWCDWCDGVGRKEPGTEQIFGRDLLAAIPTLRRVRPKKDGERYRGYEGIGLLSPW